MAVGVGTIAMGSCSSGERLGSALNAGGASRKLEPRRSMGVGMGNH